MIFKKNDMKKPWKKLIKNYEIKYTGFSESFNKGISENEFNSYENKFGFKLPNEMRELYYLCNGDNNRFIAGSILGLKFLSLDNVFTEWKKQEDLMFSLKDETIKNLDKNCRSIEPGKIKCKYINTKWIPIADDAGGNYIGIDLDPDDKGKVGQIINFGRDEDEKIVIANSLHEFVSFMADLVGSNECVAEDYEGEKVFVFDGYWHSIDYLKSKRK